MGHDPFNMPYRQSPSPNHHESYATPSYPLHTISPPPPPPPFHLQPQQQQQPYHTFTPDQSFSAADLNLPPPPLSNQTSTTLFQPYEDPDQEVEDMGDLPLLRAPSGRSQESFVNIPGRYDSIPPADDDANNNIRYGRIPQRVPRRNKTLKRVECVSYLFVTSAH
jgi:chitin synthase